MRRFIVVVLLLTGAGLLFVGGKKFGEARIEERLKAAHAGMLTPEQTSARTAQALILSKSSLDRITQPNVYGFLEARTLESLFKTSAASVLAQIVPPENFEVLELKPDTLKLDIGLIRTRLRVRGRLASPNLSFEGAIDITAAPAFDGAAIVLLPLSVHPTIEEVTLWDIPDNRWLPGVAENVIAPIMGVAIAATSQIAIPLQLGVTENLDLANALREHKELVSVSAPPVAVRQAFAELALLVAPDGLELVGEAKTIPKPEYDASLYFLRDVAKKIRPARPCVECTLDGLDLEAYFTCVKASLRCRANQSLGGQATGERPLTTVELLALHDLRYSSDASDRAAHEKLRVLLAPRITGEEPSGWSQERVRELFASLRQRMQQLRGSVDAANEFPDLRTGLILRRDYLGRLVNDSLAGVEVTVQLNVPEQKEQPIENEIKTDDAPDLKCTENAGGCDSDFKYDGHHPRGCDSNCMTRKCVLGICGDVPDLGCAARKGECELRKEKERIEYEIRKAEAHARFLKRKAECEIAREMKLTACEINQGWLEKTSNMTLGRVNGSYRVKEASAMAKKLTASAGERLSRVTIRGSVAGSAKLDADIVYSPVGLGHVVCVSQWGGPLHAEVQLQPVDLTIEGTLDEAATARERNALVFRIAEQKVKFKMVPPPGLALVTQTPQVVVACPVPAALFAALPGAAGPAGHLVQVHLLLKDEFEQTIPARELRIPLSSESSGAIVRIAQNVVAIEPAQTFTRP